MPAISADAAKQSAQTVKDKLKAEEAAEQAKQFELTEEAVLRELASSVAKRLGMDAAEVTMIVCKRGRRS